MFALSILASALLLTACQPKKVEPEEQAVSEVKVEQEQVKLVGVNEKLKLALPECDGKNCPDISLERLSSNQSFIDTFIDEKILSLIQNILSPEAIVSAQSVPKTDIEQAASESALAQMEMPKQKLEKQMQPYTEGLLNLDKELKEMSASHSISVMVSPKILNASEPLATVVMNSSNYLGGAHGSSSQNYYNFDLLKKQQVKLDDILIAQQKTKLEAKAHEAFQTWIIDSKLATNAKEYEQAWKFVLTDNFYLAKQGLVLQYAEYEIGPYVVGLPRLVIPYDQLDGIVKAQYLPKQDQAASVAQSSALTQK